MSSRANRARTVARRRAVAAGALVIVVALIASGLVGNESEPSPAEIATDAAERAADDSFVYDEGREEEFERRAALGSSHVIYAKSPGGVLASARRTARFREQIEAAAAEHDTDADLMEAMVLLESAGRPEVIAGDDPKAAAGLGQILASTATSLLEMEVDLGKSRRLTRRLSATKSRKQHDKLLRRRAEVDERFDPEAALDGMGRYLATAAESFGREQLAVVSYHMGIGNLSEVIRRYTGVEDDPGDGLPDLGGLVEERDLSYARLFFDSSPLRNEPAWSLLASLGDDSSTYYWRVLACAEIMRLWRDDRERLERLAELHGSASTAEAVFQSEGGLESETVVSIPDGAELGYELDLELAETGATLDSIALATLAYMAAKVRAIAGGSANLAVTAATGHSFEIRRDYASDRQARAFQFVLDRLRALAAIDYAVGPKTIEIVVSNLAAPLLD